MGIRLWFDLFRGDKGEGLLNYFSSGYLVEGAIESQSDLAVSKTKCPSCFFRLATGFGLIWVVARRGFLITVELAGK